MADKVPYVMIPFEEYRSLLISADKLYALDCGGVDNWSWYYDSLQEYLKDMAGDYDPKVLEEYAEAHDMTVEELGIEDFTNISLRDQKLYFPEI